MMDSKISLTLPNTAEMRSVLRRISDRCFEEHARRSHSQDRRAEAWLRAGTEIATAIEPERLESAPLERGEP